MAIQKKPAAAAAPTAAGAAAPAAGGGGKIALIVGVLMSVAGVGAGGWFYMQSQKAEAKVAAPEKKKPPVFLPLDQFTVNLTSTGPDHFLQIGLTLEVSGPEIAEQLKLVMPVVRSRLLLLLASKTADDISKTAGKQKLMEEILAEARAPMPAGNAPVVEGVKPTKGIEQVHFSSFVIQ